MSAFLWQASVPSSASAMQGKGPGSVNLPQTMLSTAEIELKLGDKTGEQDSYLRAHNLASQAAEKYRKAMQGHIALTSRKQQSQSWWSKLFQQEAKQKVQASYNVTASGFTDNRVLFPLIMSFLPSHDAYDACLDCACLAVLIIVPDLSSVSLSCHVASFATLDDNDLCNWTHSILLAGTVCINDTLCEGRQGIGSGPREARQGA